MEDFASKNFGSIRTRTTFEVSQLTVVRILSDLFLPLTKYLGIHKTRTTAYKPKANGMVERFYRRLKAALHCRGSPTWPESLPAILLEFRTSLKAYLDASPAEIVYGTTLRLPGEFFSNTPP